MIFHKKPFRSKEFMSFLHMHTKGESCCMCDNSWTQLHHFGENGGKGMKPTDLCVARLCKDCAGKHEVKATALIAWNRWELLADFQRDALRNIERWLEWRQQNGRLREEDYNIANDCF